MSSYRLHPKQNCIESAALTTPPVSHNRYSLDADGAQLEDLHSAEADGGTPPVGRLAAEAAAAAVVVKPNNRLDGSADASITADWDMDRWKDEAVLLEGREDAVLSWPNGFMFNASSGLGLTKNPPSVNP